MRPVRDGEKLAVVSVITEIELLIKPLRRDDELEVARIRSFLDSQHVHVVDLDQRHIAPLAAELRATRGLSLADAVIVATALHAGCDVIVGNDARCAQRVHEVPYVLLDDLVREGLP